MGNKKKTTTNQAQNTAAGARKQEEERAKVLEGSLQQRAGEASAEASKARTEIPIYSKEHLATGGYDPGRLEQLRGTFGGLRGEANAAFDKLGGDIGTAFAQPEGVYSDFAATGGLSQLDKDKFMRQATRGTAAVYGRSRDELQRRAAVSGGFNPSYTSSQARLDRGAAQAGAEAATGGNVELARLVREGKIAGAGGLTDINKYRTGYGLDLARAKTGFGADIAGREAGLESDVASGKRTALGGYQRFMESQQGEVSDAQKLQLSNRLSQLGYTQEETNTLLNIAAQSPSLFDRVMQGIGIAGGAVAGIAGGFKGGN